MYKLFPLLLVLTLLSGMTAGNPSAVPLRLISNPLDLRFDHLMEKDGLSSQISYFMLKDKYGFIWIVTNNGLDRFDGNNIKTFRNNGRDAGSLPRAVINSLFEDRNGRLWIATGDGLVWYDRSNESFVTEQAVAKEENAADNIIYAIHEDHRQVLWLFTGAGLYSFDPSAGSFTSFKDYNIGLGYAEEYRILNIDYNVNRRFCEDRERNIWIGTTHNGLFRIDPDRNRMDHYLHDPEMPGTVSDNSIRDVKTDSEGVVWIISGKSGLERLTDREAGLFEKYNITGSLQYMPDILMTIHIGQQNAVWIFSQQGITKINATDLTETDYSYPSDLGLPVIYGPAIEDPENLWFCTSTGLFRFNKFTSELYRYSKDDSRSSMLRNICYSVIRDDEGALWINHLYPGIDRASFEGKAIRSFVPFSRDYLGLDSYYIPFVDADNVLWIGHRGGGLMKYDFDPVSGFTDRGRYLHYVTRLKTLSSNHILDISQDMDGRLWIGTENGLNEFDPGGDRFTRYFQSLINPATIAPVYLDGNGVIWLGMEDRLVRFDSQKQDYRYIDIRTEDSVSYGKLWINDIYEDVAGNFWIATGRTGLLLMNRKTGICKAYQYDQNIQGSISSNNINTIHEDRQGRFWLGTEFGLNLMDRESGTFSVFGEETGFYDEYIFDIEEDEQGNLWLCTRKGITEFNPADSSVTNLDEQDGMVNTGFIFRCARSAETGIMFFGGPDGIDYFHPDQIRRNPYIPPVYITSLRINNTPMYFDRPVPELEKIKLPYNSNDLTFEFVCLNYTQAWKNQYAYMLEGYDDDWNYSGSYHEARYTNIDPGKYVFRVKGSNNDQVWNEEGDSLAIIIRPPLWRSWLAFLIYAVLALLLIYTYNRLRTWRLENEKRELEKQVEERTKDIEDQKEEILTTNDELEMQKEELKSTLEKLQKAQSQLIIAEKMAALGELVAGMAHEINTPVGISVTAASSLLNETRKIAELYKQDEISRTDFKDFLNSADQTAKMILSNMERTDAMIQSFKQVSVDQSTEQKRKFVIKSYLKDLILSLYPKTRDKKIKVSLDCPEELSVTSYPGAFAQIITNLVINSMSHGFDKDGGKISIKIGTNDKEIIIEYTDDGKGIPPDVMPRIFDPFYTTDHAAGTGLGLHIVYNLVTQKLEGTISCESEEEGGVRFEIRIPVNGNDIS